MSDTPIDWTAYSLDMAANFEAKRKNILLQAKKSVSRYGYLPSFVRYDRREALRFATLRDFWANRAQTGEVAPFYMAEQVG